MVDVRDTLADVKGAALRCFYFAEGFRGRKGDVEGGFSMNVLFSMVDML